jgi:hypothetical protein
MMWLLFLIFKVRNEFKRGGKFIPLKIKRLGIRLLMTSGIFSKASSHFFSFAFEIRSFLKLFLSFVKHVRMQFRRTNNQNILLLRDLLLASNILVVSMLMHHHRPCGWRSPSSKDDRSGSKTRRLYIQALLSGSMVSTPLFIVLEERW